MFYSKYADSNLYSIEKNICLYVELGAKRRKKLNMSNILRNLHNCMLIVIFYTSVTRDLQAFSRSQ